MKLLTAFIIGSVFGLGIALSGMANPAKVLNFFDVAGHWDPSLIFVMGGALITTAIGYRLVFGQRTAPVFEKGFLVPTSTQLDKYLIGGSAVFGIGWGISGSAPLRASRNDGGRSGEEFFSKPVAAGRARVYNPLAPRGSLPGGRLRSVAQSGSAPRSGRGGRRFESCHSDQKSGIKQCLRHLRP